MGGFYPPTLLLESLAQAGGWAAEKAFDRGEDPPLRAVLVAVRRARLRPVRPGQLLELTCRLVSTLGEAASVEAEAQTDGRWVAKAALTYSLRRITDEAVHRQRRRLYELWAR